MKKDLKNFKKRQVPPELEASIKESMNKSEGELMQDLMQAVSLGKQNGTFNDKSVDEFIKKVSPMLNAEQKKKMSELIKKIK